MGGRGSSSGTTARGGTGSNIKKIDGVKGTVFTTWADVNNSSPNDIWAEGGSRPHAILKNDRGTVQVSGDKKDKFGLLNSVNTASVHLRGIDHKNYTAREVNRLNKSLSQIRKLGFDTPKISINSDEVVVFAKRKLFTKNF